MKVFFTAMLEGRSQLRLPVMHFYFSHLLPAATCQSYMTGRLELLSVCIAERLYSFWLFSMDSRQGQIMSVIW